MFTKGFSFRSEHLLHSPPTSHENGLLVVFGEVFESGYVNGLILAAQKRGWTVLESTVGRRDADLNLRPLSDEEVRQKKNPVINIPLETGFDLTPISVEGRKTSLANELKSVKLQGWQDVRLPAAWIEEAHKASQIDFHARVQDWVKAVEKYILSAPQAFSRVVFAHTMAGGVPRAKIVMPLMNRVFKGKGDRFLGSEEFLNHDIGQFALKNFDCVTADSFSVLVKSTESIRDLGSSRGFSIDYLAYGYHGTEIQIGSERKWQTYTPYVQGFAKMKLEESCRNFFKKDSLKVRVANCPEILTNSSSIFQGVELSLYPLVKGLKSEPTLELLRSRLAEKNSLEEIDKVIEAYYKNPITVSKQSFEAWPENNSAEQMEIMLEASQRLRDLHKDPQKLITQPLSEIVFRACGEVMMQSVENDLEEPVFWIHHDVIEQLFNSGRIGSL